MLEEGFGVVRRDGVDGILQGVLELWDESRFDPTQSLFELGPSLLDGVEIGRVGRQVNDVGATAFDGLSYAFYLVCSQIIENDQVARFEARYQHLLNESEEDIAVGGRFDAHTGQDAVGSKGCQNRQGAPVTCGDGLPDPLSTQAPAVKARHLRGDAAFVQEHQALWIGRGDQFPPRGPQPKVLSAVLLLGV